MISFTLIKSYIQLRLNKKKTREQILDLQEKKFRKILKFAYKNQIIITNFIPLMD